VLGTGEPQQPIVGLCGPPGYADFVEGGLVGGWAVRV
jgi:hypothetical protein